MLSQTIPIQKFRRKMGIGEQGEGRGVWGVTPPNPPPTSGGAGGVWGVGRGNYEL